VSDLGKHLSLWLDLPETPARPPLDGGESADVVVVGAGITGLTTALLLARDGRSVTLVEADRNGSGASGHTTAKVTSQHGLTYAGLASKYGADAARTYGAANEAALERIGALVGEGIECDFRRRDAYVYAATEEQADDVEAESEAAEAAGLPAGYVSKAPLPFDTHGAVVFHEQAEFHVQRYLLGLAELFEQAGGRIAEGTTAKGVSEGKPCVVETDRGEIEAGEVVIATLLPFLDRAAFFARAHPMRSYCIAARVDGLVPDSMLISAGSPTRSVRTQPFEGEELLIVGGEGHKVGSGEAEPERYELLAEFAREHWQVREITHRWSTQDYMPVDNVPYIGRLHPLSKHLWTATGMKKWGMTGGTLAAELISDAIAGRENPHASLFSSTRFSPRGEGPKLVSENTKVAGHFFGDRLRERGGRAIEDLEPGEGAIVSADGEKVAGYRDEQGGLHAVSARCTHLYCQVRWNGAERSWDCPCHGSRFGVDGEVLNGPAVEPLPPRSTG
jgi:glycine/D-amino acid oxidase-like deaminating enzyme/nitrite reductase/ring-hydroxylating ferredoxin subunit